MKEHAVRGMIEARGLVFPDDYDGACFRCGKPGALSAGELGICLDCEDEITLTADYGDDEPWFLLIPALAAVPLAIVYRRARARDRTEALYRKSRL